MTAEVQIVEPSAAAVAGEGSTTGYVWDMVTYTVMDDLSVAPMSTICAVTAVTGSPPSASPTSPGSRPR